MKTNKTMFEFQMNSIKISYEESIQKLKDQEVYFFKL